MRTRQAAFLSGFPGLSYQGAYFRRYAMNDLSTNTNHQPVCTHSTNSIKRVQSIFDSIRSFEDLKRKFLLGEGLSPNTYRNYLQAIKHFYEFTGGMHPLQAKPADIERFYDHVSEQVDRATAALHIAGLKKLYAGIKRRVPGYAGPFDTICKFLNRVRFSNVSRL